MSSLRFVPPMMPTLVDTPPAGDAWLHEIKYDGYRTQLVIHGGEVRAFTRNGFRTWSAHSTRRPRAFSSAPTTSVTVRACSRRPT